MEDKIICPLVDSEIEIIDCVENRNIKDACIPEKLKDLKILFKSQGLSISYIRLFPIFYLPFIKPINIHHSIRMLISRFFKS